MSEIKQLLLALTEKIDHLEKKISDIDSQISAGLNDSNEIKFVKVDFTYINLCL